MKQVIELTAEQIELLTAASKQKLMEAKNKAIDVIEADYLKAVKALEGKFKTFSVDVDYSPEVKKEGTKSKKELDENEISFLKAKANANSKINAANNSKKSDEIKQQKLLEAQTEYANAYINHNKIPTRLGDDIMMIYNLLMSEKNNVEPEK